MKNKLFIAALAASITVPVMVAPVDTLASGKTFSDVSPKNVYFEIIHEMRDQNIISGYEDGTFRPSEVITRKHAAALVSRAQKLPVTDPFVKFKDVSENNPNFNDIKKLQQAGIFAPDSKGNFNPNQPLTRAEMAKVLTIAFDLDVKATKDFPDVPAGHAANKYVRAIYSNGITTGDNGLFKPDESLTRAHYAVFMHRAMNHKDVVDREQEKEQNPVVNEDHKYAEMIEIFGLKKEDVPIPKGVTFEKQNAKQVEIRVKEKHNGYATFGLANEINSKYKDGPIYDSNAALLHRTMLYKAKNANMTPEEFVAIVNEVVKNGDVYNGGDFSLFYNYDDGLLYFSDRR